MQGQMMVVLALFLATEEQIQKDSIDVGVDVGASYNLRLGGTPFPMLELSPYLSLPLGTDGCGSVAEHRMTDRGGAAAIATLAIDSTLRST